MPASSRGPAGLRIIAVRVRGPRGTVPLTLVVGGWDASCTPSSPAMRRMTGSDSPGRTVSTQGLSGRR
jgi:hypothetical protein